MLYNIVIITIMYSSPTTCDLLFRTSLCQVASQYTRGDVSGFSMYLNANVQRSLIHASFASCCHNLQIKW